MKKRPMKWWGWTSRVAIILAAGAVTTLHGTHATANANDPKAVIALGRTLFFDTSLGADGKTGCVTCHSPAHGFAESRPVAVGAFGHKGSRNTPSLLVLPESGPFFWDGRRPRLEEAVLDPVVHPSEMGLATIEDLPARLRGTVYRPLLEQAYGLTAGSSPSREQIATALVSYIRSIPRSTVPFDRYYGNHDEHALDREARDGYRLFVGKAGCASCHAVRGTPVQFTDDAFHPTGTGLEHLTDDLPRLTRDISNASNSSSDIGRLVADRPDLSATGRFVVTRKAADVGLFRTPSLRHVAETAPYMHDGSVATLDEAVDQEVYWRSLSQGKSLSLTVAERASLIAFLRSLSNEPTPPSR